MNSPYAKVLGRRPKTLVRRKRAAPLRGAPIFSDTESAQTREKETPADWLVFLFLSGNFKSSVWVSGLVRHQVFPVFTLLKFIV